MGFIEGSSQEPRHTLPLGVSRIDVRAGLAQAWSAHTLHVNVTNATRLFPGQEDKSPRWWGDMASHRAGQLTWSKEVSLHGARKCHYH